VTRVALVNFHKAYVLVITQRQGHVVAELMEVSAGPAMHPG